MRLCLRN